MFSNCKKFYYLIPVTALIFLAMPFFVSAHSGGTDVYGCHTCKTNCPNYGLSYGEYHCHQSKGLIQPEDPIRSHYGDYGTGYTEPWPDYSLPNYGSNYSYPSTPSCPLFSTYDSLSSSCKCDSGYVSEKFGGCEYGNTVCHRKYGYNSSYKSYSSTCECDYGYVFNSSEQCVSKDDYCQDLYGYGAKSDYADKCGCKSGYEFSGGKCILTDNDTDFYLPANIYSPPAAQKTNCPANASAIGNSCYCNAGYQTNSDKKGCELILPAPTPAPFTCGYGLLPRNGQCISYTQNCVNSFGANVIGSPGTENNSSCSCALGYEWNGAKTACIKSATKSDNKNSILPSVKSCDEGYSLSLNKKTCVKIPQNAHPANNGNDVWLCDDDFLESGNKCVASLGEILKGDTNQSKVVENIQNKEKIGFMSKFFNAISKLFK